MGGEDADFTEIQTPSQLPLPVTLAKLALCFDGQERLGWKGPVS
jgi:hypothetical protein